MISARKRVALNEFSVWNHINDHHWSCLGRPSKQKILSASWASVGLRSPHMMTNLLSVGLVTEIFQIMIIISRLFFNRPVLFIALVWVRPRKLCYLLLLRTTQWTMVFCFIKISSFVLSAPQSAISVGVCVFPLPTPTVEERSYKRMCRENISLPELWCIRLYFLL